MTRQPGPSDIEVLEKTTVFRGYFRVDAYILRHGKFGGGWTGVMRREVFERGHAAAVLPYDPERGVFVMCEQFRVGAYLARMNPWQLEIVAGIIEDGETPEDVCLREAEEEAGRTITDLWSIQRYLASPGATTETIQLYLGRISAEGAGGIFGLASEHEDIRAAIMTEAELKAAMEAGEITNGATLIAVQWFFLNRERILQKWRVS